MACRLRQWRHLYQYLPSACAPVTQRQHRSLNHADLLHLPATSTLQVAAMNDNIEERINLQKALFELEDLTVSSKYELRALQDFLESGGGQSTPEACCAQQKHAVPAKQERDAMPCHAMPCHAKPSQAKPSCVPCTMPHRRYLPCPTTPPPHTAGYCCNEDVGEAVERRAVLLEAVRDNEEEAARYAGDIQANEAARRELQGRIDAAVDRHQSSAFLKVLSTFRMQVRCGAVRCGAVRCGAVRCGAVRCGAVRCGAVRQMAGAGVMPGSRW
jgi:hypothetical protein